jgi:hypothetical protein
MRNSASSGLTCRTACRPTLVEIPLYSFTFRTIFCRRAAQVALNLPFLKLFCDFVELVTSPGKYPNSHMGEKCQYAGVACRLTSTFRRGHTAILPKR